MILSKDQVKLFWREWPKACQVQGWTRAKGMSAKEIDAKRKEFLQRCGFDSLTKVDRTEGFTRVKNELLILQRPDLKAARETVDPGLNEARVLRHQLLTELIPCLELYVADVRAYLAEALANQDCSMRDLDLMHLSVAQLTRLRFTISARLNAKRKAAGDTGHDMRMKAGVACHCAKCTALAVPQADAQPSDGDSTPVTFIAPLHGPAELVGDPF
jgi:hypothetical protein